GMAASPRARRHTLLPYTPLFRSEVEAEAVAIDGAALRLAAPPPAGRRVDTVLLYLPDIGFEVEIRVVEQQGAELTLQRAPPSPRSEEHTSELQSREKLVCRLLLE